jgi:hypothetical protein
VTSFLLPQLLVGPLLGAFWTLQRVHPARFARDWFGAWATLYATATLAQLVPLHPEVFSLSVVPGSLHPSSCCSPPPWRWRAAPSRVAGCWS